MMSMVIMTAAELSANSKRRDNTMRFSKLLVASVLCLCLGFAMTIGQKVYGEDVKESCKDGSPDCSGSATCGTGILSPIYGIPCAFLCKDGGAIWCKVVIME